MEILTNIRSLSYRHKNDDIKTNIIDNIKENDHEFTLVIKTIIKNITRVYRTYDMEKLTSETNCEMYEYLKTKPKFVLDNLLYDMCIFFVDDYNRYKFNKRI